MDLVISYLSERPSLLKFIWNIIQKYYKFKKNVRYHTANILIAIFIGMIYILPKIIMDLTFKNYKDTPYLIISGMIYSLFMPIVNYKSSKLNDLNKNISKLTFLSFLIGTIIPTMFMIIFGFLHKKIKIKFQIINYINLFKNKLKYYLDILLDDEKLIDD